MLAHRGHIINDGHSYVHPDHRSSDLHPQHSKKCLKSCEVPVPEIHPIQLTPRHGTILIYDHNTYFSLCITHFTKDYIFAHCYKLLAMQASPQCPPQIPHPVFPLRMHSNHPSLIPGPMSADQPGRWGVVRGTAVAHTCRLRVPPGPPSARGWVWAPQSIKKGMSFRALPPSVRMPQFDWASASEEGMPPSSESNHPPDRFIEGVKETARPMGLPVPGVPKI